jgi:hypothetical protein
MTLGTHVSKSDRQIEQQQELTKARGKEASVGGEAQLAGVLHILNVSLASTAVANAA